MSRRRFLEEGEVLITANEVAQLRAFLGVSQSVLAALLHLPLGSIARWERGEIIPSGAANIILHLLLRLPLARIGRAGTLELLRGKRNRIDLVIALVEEAQRHPRRMTPAEEAGGEE